METSTCEYCGKPIRQNAQGYWGARKRADPHPWYCEADPAVEKRHEPVGHLDTDHA